MSDSVEKRFEPDILVYTYMFRTINAHLQEDTVVHMQHMVLSLSTRAHGGLSVHSLSENCVPTSHSEL